MQLIYGFVALALLPAAVVGGATGNSGAAAQILLQSSRGFSAGAGTHRLTLGASDPRVAPVRAFLKAVHSKDLVLFKTVYSARMRAKFATRGWQKAFAGYVQQFKTFFGDDKPSDFALRYDGNESRGVVKIAFKGKATTGLDVTKEADGWKIDEL